MFGRIVAVLLLLSCVTTATAARADERAECIAALDDDAVAAMLDRTRSASDRAETRARRWFFVWIALNGAFAVGSSVYAITAPDRLQRDAGIWSAAGSTFTLGMMFAPPVASAFATRRLERSGIDVGRDPRRELAARLDTLALAASQERALRAPLAHVVGGAYSLAEGLYLGLRYDDSLGTAVLNAVGTMAFSEAQILSAPREAARAHARMSREGLPCVEGDATAPRVTFEPASAGVRMHF